MLKPTVFGFFITQHTLLKHWLVIFGLVCILRLRAVILTFVFDDFKLQTVMSFLDFFLIHFLVSLFRFFLNRVPRVRMVFMNIAVLVIILSHYKYFSLPLTFQAAKHLILRRVEVKFNQILTTLSGVNYD